MVARCCAFNCLAMRCFVQWVISCLVRKVSCFFMMSCVVVRCFVVCCGEVFCSVLCCGEVFCRVLW